jgi:predicted RNase H-like HicB family nuclease
MQFSYPAVFKKVKKDCYKGYFPDLDGIEVTGYSLDDAIRNAILAENDWILLELDEEEPQLPPHTEIADMELKKGEIARNIGVHIRFFEGWDE